MCSLCCRGWFVFCVWDFLAAVSSSVVGVQGSVFFVCIVKRVALGVG